MRALRSWRAPARCARRGLLLVLSAWLATNFASVAQAQIQLPASNLSERIVVAADRASHWTEGAYDVYLLQGNCLVNQGLTYARGREAVVWIQQGGPGGEPPHKAIVYLEGDVTINYQQAEAQAKAAGAAALADKTWFGRFFSVRPIDVRPSKMEQPPASRPAVYEHAAAMMAAPTDRVQPAQFAEPIGPPPPQVVGPPPGMIRIRLQRRSNVNYDAEAMLDPATNQWIAWFKSGVNIVVDGLEGFGSIDVDADNIVVWTAGQLATDSEGQSFQAREAPLKLYLEGNVVFRQGERTIYAQRMYYDVRRETGIVLGTELLTPVESFEGLVKLRADVVQMVGRDRFIAQNASLTTSRFGIPTYELRAETMSYDAVQQPRFNMFGQQLLTQDGEPIIDTKQLATSRNNRVYIEQIPVFYWPFMATNLEKPNFYIDDLQIKNDNVFGTQVYVDLDAYQLFGIAEPPPGTDWTISTDYFSKRGPGGGTTFDYERQTFFGVPEATNGFFDIWAIYDHGHDNLGLDRRNLIPPRKFRGRLLGQHRQLLPNNFQLTGEAGLISDFNFLEQYFEREWDELKDQTTDLELKQYVDNSTWSVFGSVRLNEFFTETQWLPRADHFWLGQSLLGDRLTYFEHSSIGYAQFKSAHPPTDPTDAAIWGPLPWETPAASTRDGGRYATRHELDMPFDLGPVKVNPYAVGELAHWDEALDFNDANRAYGALGMRASLPMWAVDPFAESTLFNVHGLAHKVVFNTDITYAQSTLDLEELALYDQIDDNNIEAFRRKLTFYDFGGPPPVPIQFDERFYALRRGMANWVAAQSTEIADDLFTIRLGADQRWQTKRGPIGNQHIVDWMALSTDITLFPNPDRDNFGTVAGLLDYDYRWHVGDRTTVVSEGYFDFFDQAPKYATAGVFIDRPPRGSIYFGFHALAGPIASNVLLTTYSYRMSPKWISTFGMSYDFVASRNIGQNFTLTRIGESFLMSINVNVDTSKNNIGANFMVTPRFFQGRLNSSSVGLASAAPGMIVPAAGAYGLE
ncbi:MAG: hypothetical protein WD845_16245 [Pirellulales bacterium]